MDELPSVLSQAYFPTVLWIAFAPSCRWTLSLIFLNSDSLSSCSACSDVLPKTTTKNQITPRKKIPVLSSFCPFPSSAKQSPKLLFYCLPYFLFTSQYTVIHPLLSLTNTACFKITVTSLLLKLSFYWMFSSSCLFLASLTVLSISSCFSSGPFATCSFSAKWEPFLFLLLLLSLLLLLASSLPHFSLVTSSVSLS